MPGSMGEDAWLYINPHEHWPATVSYALCADTGKVAFPPTGKVAFPPTPLREEDVQDVQLQPKVSIRESAQKSLNL